MFPPRFTTALSFPAGPVTGPFEKLPGDPTGEIVKLVAVDAVAFHALSQTCRYFHSLTSQGRKEMQLDVSIEWTSAHAHTMTTCEALSRFDALLRTLRQSGNWLSPQGKVPRLKQAIRLVPGGPAFIPCSARLMAQFVGLNSASKTMLCASMLKSHRKRFPARGVSMQLRELVAAGTGGQASEDVQFQRLFVDIHALRSAGEEQIEQFDDLIQRVFAVAGGRRVELVVELLKVLDLPPFEENCDTLVSTLSDAVALHASQFSLGELNRFVQLLPALRPDEVDQLFASLLLPRLDAILEAWATIPVDERVQLMHELLRVMKFVDDRLEGANDMEPHRAAVLALWRELAPRDALSLVALAMRVLMKGATYSAFVAALMTKCRVELALFEQVLLLLHRGRGLHGVRPETFDELIRPWLNDAQAVRLQVLKDVLELHQFFEGYAKSLARLCHEAREIGGDFGAAMLTDIADMMRMNRFGNPEACAALPPRLRVKVLLACIEHRMWRECGEDGLSTLLPLFQALSSLPPLTGGNAFSRVAQRFADKESCHPSFLPRLPHALLALAEKALPGPYLGPVLLSLAGAADRMGQDWLARLLAACDLIPVDTRRAWKLACSARAVDVRKSKAARELDELELQVRQLPEDQRLLAQQLIDAKREHLPPDED